MKYAKPVNNNKFWIVKDDNVNIATIEKRNNDYVVIKDSVKELFETLINLIAILNFLIFY